MIECERKFLPANDDWRKEKPMYTSQITQHYLFISPEVEARVRHEARRHHFSCYTGDLYTLTVKTGGPQMSRVEHEHNINFQEFTELSASANAGTVTKTRTVILRGDQRYEVDEYPDGTVIIEVECAHEGSPNDYAKTPDWLGREVTGEVSYYSAMNALINKANG